MRNGTSCDDIVDALIMRSATSSPDATLKAASECIRQRRFAAAAELLEAAPAAVARTPRWALLSGLVETRLGRIDLACRHLQPLTRGAEPLATEAAVALAEACHLGQRHDALRELLAEGRPWTRTPRGALMAARVHAATDPARSLDLLMGIVDADVDGDGDTSGSMSSLRRVAGFDAVRLLDRSQRYRDAYALAERLHRETTPQFPLDAYLAGLRQQQRLLAKGSHWCAPRCAPVQGTAFIVGLPRSGTTLLEQMLDRHPAVAAIGEHEGVGGLQRALIAEGVWPYRLNHLPANTAADLQRRYLDGARRRAGGDKPWTLDKSLVTWHCLPAVAALLAGSVCVRLTRDARDMAISTFLSYFDPLSFGWTASLASIREVVAAERALVPAALTTLGIAHESVVYETLVAEPVTSMQRVLARLGLPMDERVVSPEHNQRTAVTLSHAQVRRPINDASIGRWRHYDFAFDAPWDALGADHVHR